MRSMNSRGPGNRAPPRPARAPRRRHLALLVQPVADVLADGQRIEQRVLLEYHADVGAHLQQRAFRHRVDPLAVDQDRAGIGPQQPENQLEDQRFPGAAGPQQDPHRSFRDGKTQILQDDKIVKGKRHMLESDSRTGIHDPIVDRRRTADRIFRGALVFNAALTAFWLVMLAVRGNSYFFVTYDVSWQRLGQVFTGILFFNVLWGFIWYGVKSLLLTSWVGCSKEERRQIFSSRMHAPFEVDAFVARHSERRIRIADMIGRRGRFITLALAGFFTSTRGLRQPVGRTSRRCSCRTTSSTRS
jgi:Na+-transporting NADH:ubiquinone oxidoreductase subunit NqrB